MIERGTTAAPLVLHGSGALLEFKQFTVVPCSTIEYFPDSGGMFCAPAVAIWLRIVTNIARMTDDTTQRPFFMGMLTLPSMVRPPFTVVALTLPDDPGGWILTNGREAESIVFPGA
jgi:hypothetical protein